MIMDQIAAFTQSTINGFFKRTLNNMKEFYSKIDLDKITV